MRRLYSNPNAPRRTMNFSRVHQQDLDKLMNAEQRLEWDKGKGHLVRESMQVLDLERNMGEQMEYWNKLLVKSRKDRKRRPRIPSHIKPNMALAGMNPPRRV